MLSIKLNPASIKCFCLLQARKRKGKKSGHSQIPVPRTECRGFSAFFHFLKSLLVYKNETPVCLWLPPIVILHCLSCPNQAVDGSRKAVLLTPFSATINGLSSGFTHFLR